MKIKNNILLLVITFIPIFFIVIMHFKKSPEEALNFFKYSKNIAEDQLKDPLILCGKSVVPLVLEEVTNIDMPRRRYAIAFLGNGKYQEAIPVLTEIFNNEGEADMIRGDALIAISTIDLWRGKALAEKVIGQDGHIGYVADLVKFDKFTPQQRTYLDALLNKHN